LFGQEKETKEKATPCLAPSGYPALRAKPGGCATRPNKPHTTRLVAELKQCSPKTPVLAVLLGAAAGDWGGVLLPKVIENVILQDLTPEEVREMV
jgi:hypothetical protein